MHTQCLLRKGNQEQVSWIPSQFAIEGSYVKLRSRGSEWDDGWRVMSVWTTMASSEIDERSRDYKHQREASDRPRDVKRKKIRG
jgi:hypothetical protein